ncbi:MAG: EF-Tu/IF-2/RF-3 family GTPase [Thermoplasmatota archaeon]
MEEKVGEVEHYFTDISVAAIKITDGSLHVGDTIHIVGATTDFSQPVRSMEIDQTSVDEVSTGDEVGIKTVQRVREGDTVYLVVE